MSLTGTPAPVVEVRDLSKRYRRRDPLAVDSVSVAMEPGQALGPARAERGRQVHDREDGLRA